MDFGVYLENKPGCLVGIGTMREGQSVIKSGDPMYDYNDKIMASSVYFQTRLIEDRLGIQILPTIEDEMSQSFVSDLKVDKSLEHWYDGEYFDPSQR